MTTPDAYAEHLQRQRHLWGDKGPLWRERQREPRKWIERHWRKIITVCALWAVTCVAALGIMATQAFAFPTLGYIKTCKFEVMDCTPVDPETVALTPELISDLEALRDAVTYRFDLRVDPPESENDPWNTRRTIVDCDGVGLFYLEELLAKGYERGALRFGQGQKWDGERHLFLTVFTDQGLLTIDAYQIVMIDRLGLENIRVESHTNCNQQRGCIWEPVYPTETYVATMQDREQ